MLRKSIGSLVALLCLSPAAAWAGGAVYAMTNALDNNEVLVYSRATNGNLTLTQTIATGGGGSGRQLAGFPYQRDEARRRRDAGETLVDIARTYGVSHMTIARAVEAPSI
jgi:hypothetical protein